MKSSDKELTPPKFIQISAPVSDRCFALGEDGTVWCYTDWGDTKYGFHSRWGKLIAEEIPKEALKVKKELDREYEAKKELETFLGE